MFTLAIRLGTSELALDVLEVGPVPAFGQPSINESAAGVDVKANLTPGCGYTHERIPGMGRRHMKIGFYDVGSFEAHGAEKNVLIGNRLIDLPPEHLHPFRPVRESNDYIQF